MSEIFDRLVAYCISTVLSGSSGVTSFYTLFLMGCIERYDPDLLHMSETMDKVLASMPALIVLGFLAFCEFLAMCIPVIDELVDGCMTLVVPFISIISTLGTWGLYLPDEVTDAAADILTGDTVGNSTRLLEEASFGEDLKKDVGFAQIFALVTGVGVALAVHLIKMLVRLFGEGWLTNILAILEIIIVTFSVVVVVFIQYVAILFAACLLTSMVWYFSKGRREANKKKKEKEEEAKNQQQENQAANQQTTGEQQADQDVANPPAFNLETKDPEA